ncbi:MAG: hypothetical protein GX930_01305, partial [Clostridia bacterium]|nr:hypothetical protein [Clostridia bacterium]
MNCQEAKQVFYKYLDQELSLPEEEALSAHLRVCRECREEYRLVLETHNLLQKTIVPVTPPADLTERIMTAYDLSVENNSKSLSDQPKGWLERLKDSVSQWAGSRQLMTAAVSLGVLMIFLFGTKFYTPDQKIAGVDAPGVDTKPTEQVDLGKQNDPPPVPGTEDVQAPENAGEKTGIEGPEDKTDPKPPEQPGAGENNPPKKSESIQGGKNIIQLPRAGSPQNGTDSVEVVPLVANLTGNVVDPVLTKDGSAVCYTMAANGKSQLWQVELKTGAEPQKVETEPEEGIISEKELPEWWPGEIPVD